MEDDCLIEAFIQDVLSSRNISCCRVWLPGRFEFLMRRSCDVAVIGATTNAHHRQLAMQVLERREIPIMVFCADPYTPLDEPLCRYPVSFYDRSFPERLAEDVLKLIDNASTRSQLVGDFSSEQAG